MKLTHRFILIFFSALIVGVSLMGIIIYSNFQVTQTKYINDMYTSIESIIDNYFDHEVSEMKNILAPRAIDTKLIESLKTKDTDWIKTYIGNPIYEQTELGIHSIYIYSPRNNIKMAFGNLTYDQINEVPIVRRTLFSPTFHYQFQNINGLLYLFVAMPAMDDAQGQPTGVIMLGRTLSIGRVTELTGNLDVFSVDHFLLNEKPSGQRIDRYKTGDTLWMHFPIPNNQYAASWLHLKFSMTNILSLFKTSFNSVIFIASATFMVILGLVLWQTVKTSKMIEDNVGQIESIASGERTDTLPERGSQELVKLSKSVNKLARDLSRQHRMIEQGYFDSIQLLVKTMEFTDYYTKGHSDRVAEMARTLGYLMQFDKIDQLYTAALMHDIGKVSIPQNILNKAGPLTESEFQLIRQHPVTGHKILEASFVFEEVKEYILHHHEKYNGTGYPYGLKGHNIPLGSRILSVVDVFDALTSDRSYRKAMALDDAVEIIVQDSGTAFDPVVVQAFIDNIDEIYKHTALYEKELVS